MGTRREFLRGLAGGALLATAAGCRTPAGAAPAATQALPDAGAARLSTVALVRPSQWPSLKAAVRDVIARAGGLSFIRPDQVVLLKPAVNSARRYPATSDPEVVLEVARLVLEAGGRPVIADRTMFLRSTADAFRALELDSAAREAKVPLLPLDDAKVVRVAHPKATHWSGAAIPIYRPVAEADHVINLCTPRTHRLGDFTMALKNLVGVVDGGARMGMHLPGGFKERLAELSLAVRPSLVLMDGRQGFTDGGPDEGDLAKLDFLAASDDPVAIDAVGVAQLRLAGANPRLAKGSLWALPVLAHARELDLGVRSAQKLRFFGLAPEEEQRLRRELA